VKVLQKEVAEEKLRYKNNLPGLSCNEAGYYFDLAGL